MYKESFSYSGTVKQVWGMLKFTQGADFWGEHSRGLQRYPSAYKQFTDYKLFNFLKASPLIMDHRQLLAYFELLGT